MTDTKDNLIAKKKQLQAEIAAIDRRLEATEQMQYREFCKSLLIDDGKHRVVWEVILNEEIIRTRYSDFYEADKAVDKLFNMLYGNSFVRYGETVELQDNRAYLPYYQIHRNREDVGCYIYLQAESELTQSELTQAESDD